MNIVQASLCTRKDVESSFHRCGNARKDLESIFHHCEGPVKLVHASFSASKAAESRFYNRDVV